MLDNWLKKYNCTKEDILHTENFGYFIIAESDKGSKLISGRINLPKELLPELEQYIEEKAQKRAQWLEEHSVTEFDVLEDENGEYIWDEPTLMDEGENESSKPRKIYLDQLTLPWQK